MCVGASEILEISPATGECCCHPKVIFHHQEVLQGRRRGEQGGRMRKGSCEQMTTDLLQSASLGGRAPPPRGLLWPLPSLP